MITVSCSPIPLTFIVLAADILSLKSKLNVICVNWPFLKAQKKQNTQEATTLGSSRLMSRRLVCGAAIQSLHCVVWNGKN